jgi:hypothetical protein
MRSVVERKSRPSFRRWNMKGLMVLVGPIIKRISAEGLDR